MTIMWNWTFSTNDVVVSNNLFSVIISDKLVYNFNQMFCYRDYKLTTSMHYLFIYLFIYFIVAFMP